ncbi:MAG: FAD-dependent oxidoreductase [Promethearchaeota archaeon]|jgi:thioredoxin reductase/Fe-S-cluster-containing hydrogenase component 2/bacterioferritin-associated ferredoxin
MEDIKNHPILDIPEKKAVNFCFDGKNLKGYAGMVISSALFLNKIKIFGHHVKDRSPQGLFCANGQCSQCNVIANGIPVKACMTPLIEDMVIESCNGLPELPAEDVPVDTGDSEIIDIEVLVIGAGPAGLSATRILGENDLNIILIDDKARLGGKLVLQTHKFFGSEKDVYAGKRGIDIAQILGKSVQSLPSVQIWLNSVCLAVFSDGYVGILKNNKEYVLVKPNNLLVTTGAREKMLVFPGNTLPGVYGAGAFQTLVNRDLVKAAEKVFIVGGGNVGLIAGYHAIQAGIEVIGLIEAMPQCGGYKVHEDKLRRLGVPIYTNHTIISANGEKKVESITIGQLDKTGNILSGSEKSYDCDTILIAVGLNPVDEFYSKAVEYGLNAWVAGDAQEIAEASAAIFTGRIEALKILLENGISIPKNLDDLKKFAKIMKAKPPLAVKVDFQFKEEGIYPVFYCTQEIPCNPCASVCDQEQIRTIDDLITKLPYFKGEKDCLGCGKCVAVCPGLAVVLHDYRKDKDYPLLTFPLELSDTKLDKGQKIIIVSNEEELGEFEIYRARVLTEFPKTQLITIKLPSEIAKKAVGIKLISTSYNEPIERYQKSLTEDATIVCRCERVSVGEIRKWIQSGVKDFNELKALTKAGMGSCGSKTCTSLIYQIFREEGIPAEDITPGTKRPLFIEVPMGIFAGIRNNKDKV